MVGSWSQEWQAGCHWLVDSVGLDYKSAGLGDKDGSGVIYSWHGLNDSGHGVDDGRQDECPIGWDMMHCNWHCRLLGSSYTLNT